MSVQNYSSDKLKRVIRDSCWIILKVDPKDVTFLKQL